MIDCIIGLDPGASGGLTIWRPNHVIEAKKMPKNLNDIRDYINHLKSISSPIIFIEKLGLRADDISIGNDGGVNMGKLYRIQKMMQNYEQLKAIITVCDIPFIQVHPMTWQSRLKLRVRQKGVKESKQQRKNRYKQKSSELYPELKATLWNCDATLIMHFGRHVLQNDMNWVYSNLPTELHKKLF